MEKSSQATLVVYLVLSAFIVSVGFIGKNPKPLVLSSETGTTIKDYDESVTKSLTDKGIVMVQPWHVDTLNRPLFCVVQQFDHDPHYDGNGEKLSIYDNAGTKLYEDYFTSVDSMHLSAALRTELTQLVIEVNYGGNTANLLQMLDYRDGKVVKVPIKGDADFDSGAEVRPQFRHGIVPAKEPYQIMLTEGVGLASPVEKLTHVYRYKNGAYQYVGKFNQHDVDDYIEKLMTKGSNSSRQSAQR